MSRTYSTMQGDMWDAIAFTQLGDAIHTDKLLNLNQEYRDYYVLPAGVTLVLPEIEAAVSSVAPPWRQVGGL